MSNPSSEGWTKHSTELGVPFWYNKISKRSSWTPPPPPAPKPPPLSGAKGERAAKVEDKAESTPSASRRSSMPKYEKRKSLGYLSDDPEANKSFSINHKIAPQNFDTKGLIPRIYIPTWADDKGKYGDCSLACGVSRARHVCRLCGRWVCPACSQKIFLPKFFVKKQHKSGARRVCNNCEKAVMSGAVLIGKSPPMNFSEPIREGSHMGSLNNVQSMNMDDIQGLKEEDVDMWIQCVEVGSGRKLWYHAETKKIRFIPPSKKLPEIPPEFIETKPGWFFDVDSGKSEQFYSEDDLKDHVGNIEQNIQNLLQTCSPQWNFNNPDFKSSQERFDTHPRWTGMKDLAPNHFEHSFPQFLYRSSFSNIPKDAHILVQVKCVPSLMSGNSQTTTRCSLTDKVGEVIRAAIKKLKLKDLDEKHYMLKVAGREEYLASLSSEISAFRCVCQSIKKNKRLVLRLVHRPMYIDPPRNLVELHKERTKSHSYDQVISFADARTELSDANVISLDELDLTFRIKIHGVDNISKENLPRYEPPLFTYLFMRIEMYHSDRQIFPAYQIQTGAVCQNRNVTFDQVIQAEIKKGCKANPTPRPTFSNIPYGTRINIGLYGYKGEAEQVLLAYVNLNISDADGRLWQGFKALPMWPCPAFSKEEKKKQKNHNQVDQSAKEYAVLGPLVANYYPPDSKIKPTRVRVEFDVFEKVVICPTKITSFGEIKQGEVKKYVSKMSKGASKALNVVKKIDALCSLNEPQKTLVWDQRKYFQEDPLMLPKFLLCVDWTDEKCANEAKKCMQEWAPLSPYQALELLGYQYSDYEVRLYAVERLRIMGDDELREVLLQITQLLKFEPHHDSPLARFVIERGVANPYGLGHFLFWHLKAELHNRDHCERFYLLLRAYLKASPRHMRELTLQNKMINKFEYLADQLVRLKRDERKDKHFCRSWLQNELKKLNFPSRLQLTLDPTIQATQVIPPECKFMSSKKLPLWLVFENVDADETNKKKIYVIFKSGDDLRQDILTLQMLRLMDSFWCAEGLDLKLSPYTCVATGVNKDAEGVGMIEVVLNSDTISHIQIENGGAFDKAAILKYLEKKSKETGITMKAMKETFLLSAAGYCVATHNLGIGDRHNGNIMLTKFGNLFHIDFGHFLGNFKQKFGFKRERSPFVFTSQMAYVVGGENYSSHPDYKKFVETCCRAYNVIRAKGGLFITLFRAMKLAGMPELTCDEDIMYLRDMLRLQDSETQASKHFKSQITLCVLEKWRNFDNAIHIFMHGE